MQLNIELGPIDSIIPERTVIVKCPSCPILKSTTTNTIQAILAQSNKSYHQITNIYLGGEKLYITWNNIVDIEGLVGTTVTVLSDGVLNDCFIEKAEPEDKEAQNFTRLYESDIPVNAKPGPDIDRQIVPECTGSETSAPEKTQPALDRPATPGPTAEFQVILL